MTAPSRFFVGSYDVAQQSGMLWLELAGNGTFRLQEDIQPFAGSSFQRVWQGEWSETDTAVTLTFREHDHGNSTHMPGSVLSLERRGAALIYDGYTTLEPSQPPSSWKRS